MPTTPGQRQTRLVRWIASEITAPDRCTWLGPAGVGERVQAAMEVPFPGSTQVRRRFPVHFHELIDRQPLRFEIGPAGLVVVPFAVVHPSGAPPLALRVTWQGHTIAYAGDTEWTEALVELAHGADLLIAVGYTYQRRIRSIWMWRACSAPAGWQPGG